MKFATLASLLIVAYCQSFAQRKSISVYFENDVYEVFDSKSLDGQLENIKKSKDIRVIGYADHLGTSEYNQALSAKRANLVRDYLISEGIDQTRIANVEAKGALPKIDEAGDAKNRRVDVLYTEVKKVKPTPVPDPPKQKASPVTPPKPSDDVFEIDSTSKENIVLEGLSFIGGRHYPLPESIPVLEKLSTTMKQYPTLEIEIQGFICCDYEVKDGMDQDTGEPFLSANRAKFVYDYLVRQGIDPERMSYKGYGSTRPKVYPEVTEEDRQANRRVELKILRY